MAEVRASATLDGLRRGPKDASPSGMVKNKFPSDSLANESTSDQAQADALPAGASVTGPADSTQAAPQVQVQNPDGLPNVGQTPENQLQQRAQRDHMQSDGRPVIPPSLTDKSQS